MSVCLQCTYSLKWASANECKRAECSLARATGLLWNVTADMKITKDFFTEKVRNRRSWIHGVNRLSLFLSASRLPFSCSLVKQLKHETACCPSAFLLTWQKEKLSRGCSSNFCTTNYKLLCCVLSGPLVKLPNEISWEDSWLLRYLFPRIVVCIIFIFIKVWARVILIMEAAAIKARLSWSLFIGGVFTCNNHFLLRRSVDGSQDKLQPCP